MLTKESVAEYEEKGYLNAGPVISESEVDELRDELDRVLEDRDAGTPQPVRITRSGNDEIYFWQVVNIWQASRPFLKLLFNQKVVEAVAQLYGASQLRVWHDQIQYKPPRTGGKNMWHQDHPYWDLIVPETQLSAWIPLDDVDESNGCMSMVAGSYRWGNQIKFLHSLDSFDAMPAAFEGNEAKVEVRPVRKGEVHFHHSHTWHGSPENRSGRPRRAIAIHYMTEDTRYTDKGNHLMKPYVEVEDGEKLAGKYFPLVWDQGRAMKPEEVLLP
jgi:ectoine hydroxylase-related dioxygenase (phytanoyl-CoA dioxygenase family)